MASEKISELVDGAAPQNTDEFIVARSGDNYKLAWSEITAAVVTARIVLIADATAVSVAEDFASYNFIVGSDMNGLALKSISWFIKTVSSSGLPSFAVRKNSATEMLSTNCTIDVSELTSDTATTPPVINGANSGVVTGDILHFDCDAAGTGTRGSEVRMTFS